MCGIAGIWNLSGSNASVNTLTDMLSVQHYRGPEGAAYTFMNNESVLLGFLMLAFTDNQLGMQPLFNEDGSIALVYNGEIYDYEILRDELIKQGHKFRTKSDSEVLIHLYEEYGESFISRLNGEFAFVIYDDRNKKMILGRDPFGVKPLYYSMHNGCFYFSSEAKAILVVEGIPREFSPDYLSSIAIGVPNSRITLFKNVESLRPGHYLRLDNSGLKTYQYWQPDFNKCDDSFDVAKNKIRSLVTTAVHRRLNGDVPLALALSRGLDSSIIAGLSKELGFDKPVFSLGFRGKSYDESMVAEQTAKHYGLSFHHVDMPIELLAQNFKKSLWHTENTTNSLGNISRMLMHAAIRTSGLKAVMGGESGDEIFGGYPYFILESIWREEIKGNAEASKMYETFKVAEAKSKCIFWSPSKQRHKTPCPYNSPTYLFYRTQKLKLFSKLLWSHDLVKQFERSPESYLLEEVPPNSCKNYSGFDTTRLVSRSIAATYVFPGIGDRLEMANSLEGRVPFLDRDVVNYAYSLPENYFINLNSLTGKYILRETFSYLLPGSFMSPPKHTFMSPTFHDFSQTRFGSELLNHFLDSKAIREIGLLNLTTLKISKSVNKIMSGNKRTNLFLDSMIGLCLSVQILYDVFIRKHPLEMLSGFRLELKERKVPVTIEI